MKLRQVQMLGITPGGADISNDSRWVCDWYAAMLRRRIETGRVWQICFDCETAGDLVDCRLEGDGTLSCPLALDSRAYDRSTLGERKLILSGMLRDGCQRAARYLGIATEPFEKCAEEVARGGYLRSWRLKRSYSRDRKHSAVLECVQDIHEFAMHAVIRSKGLGEARVCVARAGPDSLMFNHLVGTLTWKAKSAFEVRDKRGRLLFSTE